jgi:hypothetical protein
VDKGVCIYVWSARFVVVVVVVLALASAGFWVCRLIVCGLCVITLSWLYVSKRERKKERKKG